MKEKKVIQIKPGNSVICLDSSGKPESIKTKDWVEEGRHYTIVKIIRAKIQNKMGYVLEEVQTNDPAFFSYDVARFGLSIWEIERMINSGEIEVEERILEKV